METSGFSQIKILLDNSFAKLTLHRLINQSKRLNEIILIRVYFFCNNQWRNLGVFMFSNVCKKNWTKYKPAEVIWLITGLF